MSEGQALCPQCGDPLSPPLADPTATICDGCLRADIELLDLPKSVEVLRCGHCHSYRLGSEWVDHQGREPPEIAIAELEEAVGVHRAATAVDWQVRPEQLDPTKWTLHVDVTADVGSVPVHESRAVSVTVTDGTCDRCGQIAGDSYGAILQVRGDGRELEANERAAIEKLTMTVLNDRIDVGDRAAYVTEVAETGGGIDIKLSTPQVTRIIVDRILQRYGGEVSTSETLVTEDSDGNEVYRVTFALRLPRFRPGDIIDPGDGDGPVLVDTLRETLRGRRLASGAAYVDQLVDRDPSSFDLLGSIGSTTPVTVVTVEDERSIQVLHPETFEAITIAHPTDVDVRDGEIPVVAIDGECYVVPWERIDE